MNWVICYVVTAGIAAIVAFLYYRNSKRKEFWTRHGIPTLTAKDTGGGLLSVLKGIQVTKVDGNLYKALKNRGLSYAGYMEFGTVFLGTFV